VTRARLTNTDRIVVNEATDLGIDAGGGPFAPGATDEAGVSDEIEIQANMGDLEYFDVDGRLLVNGSASGDTVLANGGRSSPARSRMRSPTSRSQGTTRSSGPMVRTGSSRGPAMMTSAVAPATIATSRPTRRATTRSKGAPAGTWSSTPARATLRVTVRPGLPAALRRVLGRKHRLSLRLTATAADPAGNWRTVGKTVTPKLKRQSAHPTRLSGTRPST
jgi:hypothetical protein